MTCIFNPNPMYSVTSKIGDISLMFIFPYKA